MIHSSKKRLKYSAILICLILPGIFEEGKHIMYAFVESMNERSKNLVTSGRI